MSTPHDNSTMSVHLITGKVSMADVRTAAQESFETMVKAVVDVERRIMAIGGELHADANAVLLEYGSRPQDLWAINIYPDKLMIGRVAWGAAGQDGCAHKQLGHGI